MTCVVKETPNLLALSQFFPSRSHLNTKLKKVVIDVERSRPAIFFGIFVILEFLNLKVVLSKEFPKLFLVLFGIG